MKEYIKDNISLFYGDFLIKANDIPDNAIDFVCSDVPFGTTKCKWDSIIPFNKHVFLDDKLYYEDEFLLKSFKDGATFKESKEIFDKHCNLGMWDHLKRITKPNSCIALYAQTPFDKKLGASNIDMLKYEWIWEKGNATGFLNAKKCPLKAHENVLIFYDKLPTYNPQKTYGHVRKTHSAKAVDSEHYGKVLSLKSYDSDERYPRDVQFFSSDKQSGKYHDTPKPVGLNEMLVKTYTNEGDTVLDFTMGGGSLPVACAKTRRKCIGIDIVEKHFNTSVNRVEQETSQFELILKE